MPWFLEPLLAVAGLRMAGVDLLEPAHARDAVQWMIGAAPGLHFTPDVAREVLWLVPWIALNALFDIALGLGGARILGRVTDQG